MEQPVGPVEWVALTFPGSSLDARVVPPLKELVDPGTVRLLDAAVLHKDADGVMTESELETEGVQAFDDLDGDVLELLSDDDLIAIAASLAPGTTTLVLVWENRWAAAFADSVRRAGGVLSAYDRVPTERVDPALHRAPLAGASA
ncbi:DUF6325 family protein [Petropleomorpha daqingensis]|uniref:DUF1269 domain-containing protein n=1 Tax=Petropleomorpha daqingensis TaxID=2026353 RepID=A0A853CBR1_9ACTN|nr:hypothetical protein [Petropleomorpha daqingensis]